MSVLSGVLAITTVLIIGGSLWFLYRIAFPSLSGGQRSLIYFREIANRTEANFIDEFVQQDDQARAKDLLGQVWRNSEILRLKFDALRAAFVLMAIAIGPWVAAVADGRQSEVPVRKECLTPDTSQCFLPKTQMHDPCL